ncbi:MAG: SCO family protein [Bacteroidetes bacterium]|nr:SCO family protein [Bacteroidota bacterium]
MRKRGYTLAVIFIILILPVVVMFCINHGKNKYTQLPYFGNYKGIAPNGDTIRHTIKSYSLTDQNHNPFGSDQLKGQVYVADFFFTSCGTICPTLTKNLIRVQEAFETAKDFHVVSISIDPEHDTAEVLQNYKAKYKIKTPNWHFLTGKKDYIYDVMNTDGFLLIKPEPDPASKELEHTGIISLVDKEGHVRGQYQGTDDEEIDRLMDEIRLLYVNYANSKK